MTTPKGREVASDEDKTRAQPLERKVLRQPLADSEIREAEREHVYSHAPVGLCYFDTELRYVQINEWLARINGLSVEERPGEPRPASE